MREIIIDGDDVIMINTDYDISDMIKWTNSDYIPNYV